MKSQFFLASPISTYPQQIIINTQNDVAEMNNLCKLPSFLIKTNSQNDTALLRRLLLLSCATAAPQALSHMRLLFSLIASPDTFAFNTIIRAHAPSFPALSLSYFSLMLRTGVSPDHYTFPFVLKASAHLHTGKDLHGYALKLGFGSDIYVQNALISFYGGVGMVGDASRVFDEMCERDVVSWASMIGCYVNCGLEYDALALFREMQITDGVEADEVTMLSVITAVSRLGALDLGHWVYAFVRRNNLEFTVSLGTALINMYSRCGSAEDSVRVFDEMPVKNAVTWTALIDGLAVHGRSREALHALYEMKRSGMRPDHKTITAVLVACSHGGLVDEGWKVFKSIRSEYGMEPLLEHYGCMVDMLGRARLVQEAFEFIERMPISPSAVIWRTLLGACVNHNCLALAERVKEKLYDMDPYHDGDYVLMSNAYGGVGKWSEKTGVRNSMKEKKINKKPGWSLFGDYQVVYEFVSGDNSHPQSKEIREFLIYIIESVRAAGYTPCTSNVLHDIEEEEKEQSLSFHSEKLAVAFALLNFNDRRKIRVMKNLRICRDCHNFMKYVSNKFDKEIIIRDRNRFHHFSKGSCSCQDYW